TQRDGRCSRFFFQAEDGIRDFHVTGVQTCALPISWPVRPAGHAPRRCRTAPTNTCEAAPGRGPTTRENGGRESSPPAPTRYARRSEEHTSELQSRENLVCRLLLENKNTPSRIHTAR